MCNYLAMLSSHLRFSHLRLVRILQFINTSCGCQSLLFSSPAWWYWHARSLMSTSPVFLVIAEFLVTPLSPLVYVQFFLLSVVSVWLYPALQHRLCQDWLACLLSAHALFPSLPDSLLLPAFHTFISLHWHVISLTWRAKLLPPNCHLSGFCSWVKCRSYFIMF